MILIIRPKKGFNSSYDEVIDWLNYYGNSYEFLSGEDYFNSDRDWSLELSIQNETFSDNFSKYKSVWFRGFLKHRSFFKDRLNELEATTNDNIGELRWRLGQEVFRVNNQIFKYLKNTYMLPKVESTKIDKYSTLIHAKYFGLKIPTSIITNSKVKLDAFLKKHKKIITKPLYETLFFNDQTYVCFFKTEIVKKSDLLKQSKETFFPSLFQEYIEKDIEIRVFYIEGKFYSMAIFSQLDSKTMVDFRNYNEETPNRCVPYSLPKSLEKKIESLMKFLELNTGSIDLIKTKNKEYYFLEVNPTGQFGFVSKPCNYFIEEEIAKVLINNKI